MRFKWQKKLFVWRKNISFNFLVRVHNICELVIVGTRRTCVLKAFIRTKNLFENETIRWARVAGKEGN